MTVSTSANTQEDNETDQQQFMAKVLQCMKTLEDKVDSQCVEATGSIPER